MNVRIFEVGPRDGLQNESRTVALQTKLHWIQGLISAGLRDLEVGAFVRGDRVQQMADSEKVFQAWKSGAIRTGKATGWALVPNLTGLEHAVAAGVRAIGVFTAASDGFNERNIGMSIEDSLDEIQKIVKEARRHKLKVRGYISTVFGCPFDGKVAPKQALKVAEKLFDLGVPEISLADTIGVADPGLVKRVLQPALKSWGAKRLAVHFHDTRGTALANTLRSLDLGIRIVDSSAGGLGGCPFAPGATGNLATEDLVYMLNGMGVKTGVNLDRLAEVNLEFCRMIQRPLSSRYLQAFASSSLNHRNGA